MEEELLDPEEVFGVSREYWEKLEKGRIIQRRGLDNYIRTLNVPKMLELMKIRKARRGSDELR
jgi:hypothetical protein